jgi:hypothetical protein
MVIVESGAIVTEAFTLVGISPFFVVVPQPTTQRPLWPAPAALAFFAWADTRETSPTPTTANASRQPHTRRVGAI